MLLYLDMLKSIPYCSFCLFLGLKQIEIDGIVEIGTWLFLKLLSFDWNFKKISQVRNIPNPHNAMKVIASSMMNTYLSFRTAIRKITFVLKFLSSFKTGAYIELIPTSWRYLNLAMIKVVWFSKGIDFIFYHKYRIFVP